MRRKLKEFFADESGSAVANTLAGLAVIGSLASMALIGAGAAFIQEYGYQVSITTLLLRR